MADTAAEARYKEKQNKAQITSGGSMYLTYRRRFAYAISSR